MKLFRTGFICAVNICCFIVISMMILALKIWPNGYSGIPIFDYFLSNITIQMVGEDEHWAEKYPYGYGKIEKYNRNIGSKKKNLEIFCSQFIPNREPINDGVLFYNKKILHFDIEGLSDEGENKQYIEQCSRNVVDFRDELEKNNIPFIFVLTPCELSVRYFREGESPNHIVQKSYFFAQELEKNDIDLIYLARDYNTNISYDISTHWKPQDALDCATLISEKLNMQYDYTIDMSRYDKENFDDLMDECPNTRESIREKWGYDFSVQRPKHKYNYTMVYAENEKTVGDFGEVLLKKPDEIIDEYAVYHNAFVVGNSLIYSIHNDDAIKKNVLVIGDSFNWPVSSYLSIGVSDITIIHNASFSGSILNYISNIQPDIVLMIYNDAEFYDMYTEDAFYLR